MSDQNSPITPLTSTQLVQDEAHAGKEAYPVRILVAFDILVNVIFMGNPDETISSRAARAATQGKTWGKLLSRFLNLFQKDHGARAEASDVERAQAVVFLEDKSGNL